MLATPIIRHAGLAAPHAAVSFRERLHTLRIRATRRWRVWITYRQTHAALSRLGAHELADLDITHADIERVARAAARKAV